MIPAFFRARLRGEAPTIHGDGGQCRDFTWVGDVVAANLQALTASRANGEAVNIGGGQRHTILELDRRISELVGGGPPARHGPERPGDIRHAHADLGLAAARLGYSPTVPLEVGLERSLSYYQRLLAVAPTG